MTVPNMETQAKNDDTDYPEYGAPKVAGDWNDDDGSVLDDLLQSQPEPLLPLPTAPGEDKPRKPVPPTQLRTGTVYLDDTNTTLLKLLSADEKRLDLTVWVTPTTGAMAFASDPATVNNVGTPVLGPGALVTLATVQSADLPEGWYDVSVIVDMYGTTAAADVNNVQLQIEATLYTLIQINPGTTGTRVETGPMRVYLDGTQRLRVRTVGAATGTATYAASVYATRVTDLDTLASYSPVLLASDPASLAGSSVSALVNAADGPGVIRLPCHTGELYAILPAGSSIPRVAISWIATTR